ncbi:MAG TPA: transporter [Terriglobales bacterium]|nr:transporter [Terriglobales bacterium]
MKLRSIWLAAALSTATSVSWAQELAPKETSCLSGTLASVPSRPTVSNGADTTQCGVMEVEYGFDHQWTQGNAHVNDLAGGLRVGILPNLDFHWTSTSFLNIMDQDGNRTGFGDTWVGVKYHFISQTRHLPAVGVFYQSKLPSASASDELGSGQVDHSLSLLFSKDVSRLHFDFNVIPYLAGRPTAPGCDHNTGFALSGSMPITRRLSLVGEGYGYTALNSASPAFASTMIGTTYQVEPRLIFDGGVDLGVSAQAPRARLYVGLTYAIANVYRWFASSE